MPGSRAEDTRELGVETEEAREALGESSPDTDRFGAEVPVSYGFEPEQEQPLPQNGVQLSYRHRLIAQLAANGWRNVDIAQHLGMTQSRVSIILGNPEVRRYVDVAQKALFDRNIDAAAHSLLPQGLNVIRETLNGKHYKQSLRVDTAFRLWERTHGKAVQKVQADTTSIRDLFEYLDKKAETRAEELSSGHVAIPGEARALRVDAEAFVEETDESEKN